MRKRVTSAVLATALAIGTAFPATAATGLLEGLPDDVVAGAR